MDRNEMKRAAVSYQLEDLLVRTSRDERPMVIAKLAADVGCLALIAMLMIKITF